MYKHFLTSTCSGIYSNSSLNVVVRILNFLPTFANLIFSSKIKISLELVEIEKNIFIQNGNGIYYKNKKCKKTLTLLLN